jgi:hypothetical protein
MSFNRAEEDLDAVVVATVAPTAADPNGIFQDNVPAPTRDTEFSTRASHQFGDRHSAYAAVLLQELERAESGRGRADAGLGGYSQSCIAKTI